MSEPNIIEITVNIDPKSAGMELKPHSLVDRLKYGKIVTSLDFGLYHVAGPVKNIGLTSPYDFKSGEEYIAAVRNFSRDYLEGKLSEFGRTLPINSDVFLLGLPQDTVNGMIKNVQSWRDVQFSGEVKQSVDGLDTYGLPFTLDKAGRKNEPEQTPSQKAEQYLRDLLIWELDCFDYSDYVVIGATEREKETNKGTRRTMLIDRKWSKANKGSYEWRVVEIGSERIAISGYEPKSGEQK